MVSSRSSRMCFYYFAIYLEYTWHNAFTLNTMFEVLLKWLFRSDIICLCFEAHLIE